VAIDGKLVSGVTVLIAVVEAGTIARAAEALGLSSSGVSRALARLEQRVGARLLARTTRSLSLTDEGRRFYEQVGPHLAGIEEAAIEAAGSGSKVRGKLRVNIDPFFSRIVLSRHLAEFWSATRTFLSNSSCETPTAIWSRMDLTWPCDSASRRRDRSSPES
jgi:DNA-binding transcriptional LysR family regulator